MRRLDPSVLKLAALVLLGGFVAGLVYISTIFELASESPIRFRKTDPRWLVAGFSLCFGAAGVWVLHRMIGIGGRAIWVPAWLCFLIAIVFTLVAVAVGNGSLPPETWIVLGIGVAFFAAGVALTIDMTRWRF